MIFLLNYTEILNVVESPYAIKSIIGNLLIESTNLTEKGHLIDAYLSSIALHNINIQNITFTFPAIKSILSSFSCSRLSFTNTTITNYISKPYLLYFTDSTINISNTSLQSSMISLALLQNTTGYISSINITSTFTYSTSLIMISNSDNLKLDRFYISN